jgi:hypothetical protein
MSNISGVRSTANTVQSRRKFDISDELWYLDADMAVLAFFARKLKKKVTIDPEYRWFDKAQPSRTDQVNNGAGYNTSATSIVVDNGDKFRAGDVVNVPATGEQMRVTGVSSNTLTVSRAWGVTAAASLADNDYLVIIGNANAEGAGIRSALTSDPTKRTNYTQIFREPIDVTGTEDATELYAGSNDMAKLREEHLQIHMKDIERAFLFGEAKEDLSNTAAPIRATGGAKSFIATHVQTTATLTQPTFETFISSVFQNGGQRKMGFVSPLIASAINSWALGKLFMYPKDKTFGIAITQYLSIHGTLDFVLERIFAENPVWNGMAFALDMDKVMYRYLGGNGKNRDTKLLKDRQANDADEVKDEYLSEIGFQLVAENFHGLLKGVTAYS